jgi:hypothetical protein
MGASRTMMLGGALLLLNYVGRTSAACLSSGSLEQEFIDLMGGGVDSLPTDGSCCQFDVCGLPCSADDKPIDKSFGIAVVVMMVLFCGVGIAASFFIKGDARQFFVAG